MQNNRTWLWIRWQELFEGKQEEKVLLCFNQLVSAYEGKERFYHNLTHIRSMIGLLEEFGQDLERPKTVWAAIFYHDCVYQALEKDNEEQSAIVAIRDLTGFNWSKSDIDQVEALILATQTHQAPISCNHDFHYLLDADLAILGVDPTIYEKYAAAIRQEYQLVPDNSYNSGRKKVLEQLINKKPIYYTALFQTKFEAQAKKNMERELKQYLKG